FYDLAELPQHLHPWAALLSFLVRVDLDQANHLGSITFWKFFLRRRRPNPLPTIVAPWQSPLPQALRKQTWLRTSQADHLQQGPPSVPAAGGKARGRMHPPPRRCEGPVSRHRVFLQIVASLFLTAGQDMRCAPH